MNIRVTFFKLTLFYKVVAHAQDFIVGISSYHDLYLIYSKKNDGLSSTSLFMHTR